MNNNMQPFYFPNHSVFPSPSYNQEIKELENRIYQLEKEVVKLKNKVSRLENTPMPLSENYTAGYQPNSYNMM